MVTYDTYRIAKIDIVTLNNPLLDLYSTKMNKAGTNFELIKMPGIQHQGMQIISFAYSYIFISILFFIRKSVLRNIKKEEKVHRFVY